MSMKFSPRVVGLITKALNPGTYRRELPSKYHNYSYNFGFQAQDLLFISVFEYPDSRIWMILDERPEGFCLSLLPVEHPDLHALIEDAWASILD